MDGTRSTVFVDAVAVVTVGCGCGGVVGVGVVVVDGVSAIVVKPTWFCEGIAVCDGVENINNEGGGLDDGTDEGGGGGCFE